MPWNLQQLYLAHGLDVGPLNPVANLLWVPRMQASQDKQATAEGVCLRSTATPLLGEKPIPPERGEASVDIASTPPCTCCGKAVPFGPPAERLYHLAWGKQFYWPGSVENRLDEISGAHQGPGCLTACLLT